MNREIKNHHEISNRNIRAYIFIVNHLDTNNSTIVQKKKYGNPYNKNFIILCSEFDTKFHDEFMKLIMIYNEIEILSREYRRYNIHNKCMFTYTQLNDGNAMEYFVLREIMNDYKRFSMDNIKKNIKRLRYMTEANIYSFIKNLIIL